MEMVRDHLDVHVPRHRQVGDRDQHGVFDTDEADNLGMTAADALTQCKKSKQIVDQPAKLGIAAVTISSGRETVNGAER